MASHKLWEGRREVAYKLVQKGLYECKSYGLVRRIHRRDPGWYWELLQEGRLLSSGDVEFWWEALQTVAAAARLIREEARAR